MTIGVGVLLGRPLRGENRPAALDARYTLHTVVERDGSAHTFSYNAKTGIWLSVAVGYLSTAILIMKIAFLRALRKTTGDS